MSDRKQYFIYCEMFEKCKLIKHAIATYYAQHRENVISDIFVSVASENERLYFIDYELSTPYRHVRQNITENALCKHFNIEMFTK